MSQHALSCLIIGQKTSGQTRLEQALRASDFKPEYRYAKDLPELKNSLKEAPGLLFCPPHINVKQQQQLSNLLRDQAPDCVQVLLSDDQWRGLSLQRNGIDTCTLPLGRAREFQQQLDYLLAYTRLKIKFRHCKHLLSIAELRSQLLVEYAREAVAYTAADKHLHANIAYLSLFGFQSETEALATPLLKLVCQEQQKIFVALNLEAEQGARPSNKLLMKMRTRQGKVFRAEIRFIPSVFRGQRCVQLHVHPLPVLNKGSSAASQRSQQTLNPWQKKATGLPARQAPSIERSAEPAKRKKKVQGLQRHYQELLNLRGSQSPALLIAQPYLQQSNGEKIRYAALLATMKQQQRYQLDHWALKDALSYLQERQRLPIKQWLWIALGDWFLTDKTRFLNLLKRLHKTRTLNPELVLAVSIRTCMKQPQEAVKRLTMLAQSGVQLALDDVKSSTVTSDNKALSELIKAASVSLIRTTLADTPLPGSPAFEANEQNPGFSDDLNALLNEMATADCSVVIDGIQDVNMLNVLCETSAAYLQGEVLDKFSR